MGLWLFEHGISWTSATRHKSFDTATPNPLIIFHLAWIRSSICMPGAISTGLNNDQIWGSMGYMSGANTNNYRRGKTLVCSGRSHWWYWDTQAWSFSNSSIEKHMKYRRLSLAFPQLLLLLSYYRIRRLTIIPAYASLIKHGTSKSSSLRKNHKDHTAYCSGEVYPRTFNW